MATEHIYFWFNVNICTYVLAANAAAVDVALAPSVVAARRSGALALHGGVVALFVAESTGVGVRTRQLVAVDDGLAALAFAGERLIVGARGCAMLSIWAVASSGLELTEVR